MLDSFYETQTCSPNYGYISKKNNITNKYQFLCLTIFNPAPTRAENPTLIVHIEKDIIENLIPIGPEPKRIIKKASFVPRFPGIKDGIKVTTPNITPTMINME